MIVIYALVNHYLNGVQSGTANQDAIGTIADIVTTNAMRIGNRSTATDRTFDGSIRSVKMWNRVLGTGEITSDYEGIINTGGLIHYFKLGGDYTDYGSVGVTATNSGSTVVEGQFAGMTKQTGRVSNLIPQGLNGVKTTILERDRELL